MRARTPCALTIAGSDSSAGAGIQADLKTFAALGVYGATAITAVTAQNTLGVTAVHLIPRHIVSAQIDTVFADLAVHAVKTGMLGGEDGITATVERLGQWAGAVPIIVDPVMVSTTGSRLLERGAERALAERLIPMAALLTPNLHEAAVLLNCDVARDEQDAKRQAEQLLRLGARAILLKGGHGLGSEVADVYFDGEKYRVYSTPRLQTRNTHGTGCTLASAIAAYLVKGLLMEDAIERAKTYLHGALERSEDLQVGAGSGPVSHFFERDRASLRQRET